MHVDCFYANKVLIFGEEDSSCKKLLVQKPSAGVPLGCMRTNKNAKVA